MIVVSPHTCTGHPSSNLIEDGQDLARYLRSRQASSKVDESRRRKGEVKVVPGSPFLVCLLVMLGPYSERKA